MPVSSAMAIGQSSRLRLAMLGRPTAGFSRAADDERALLSFLTPLIQRARYGEPLIEKLWFRNCVCVLGQTRGRAYTPWTAPLAGSKPAPTLSRQPRPHHLAGFSLSTACQASHRPARNL